MDPIFYPSSLHTTFNFLQPILIEVAALISLGLGDYPDFGIICGLLLANACLGFREEYHAKKSLDELSDQLESEIAVRREGTTTQLNVKELVPGDIVLLVGGTSELIYLVVLHREDLSCVRSHLSPLSFSYFTLIQLYPPTHNGSRGIKFQLIPLP